jgi:hypothetical protein
VSLPADLGDAEPARPPAKVLWQALHRRRQEGQARRDRRTGHPGGRVEERDAKGPTPIHANLNFFASLLSPSASVTHTLRAPVQASASSKLLYIQLVQTSGFNTAAAPKDKSTALIKVAGESGEEAVLGEGDGVFIRGGAAGDKVTLTNQGGKVGELVVFEMDA